MNQTQALSSATNEIIPEVIAEQPESSEQQVQEEAQEARSQQAETQEKEEFDPKERVEFTTPEQQKKFNDVYKQMKMSDARNKMQSDMLAKAMDKLAEFESRFQQTDHAEAERILTSRLKEAREAGDEDKADKILQEIIDFRVDSKLKPKKSETAKQDDVSPEDLENVRTVVQYAEAADENGNLLRPWINKTHPQHKDFMKLAGAVALQVQAELGYTDVNEVLIRMDDAMKNKPTRSSAPANSRGADPMRGNLTNTPAKGKMKLSPQEMAAAQKLGVKPEDYLKWKR